jgi:hypothetical protein
VAQARLQLNEVRGIMHENIELVLERGDKLDALNAKAGELGAAALLFKKGGRRLHRQMLVNKVKYGVVLGTALTAAIAVPIVVVVAM